MRLAPALARRGFALNGGAGRIHTLCVRAAFAFTIAGGVAAIDAATSRRMSRSGETKEQIARSTVTKYAYEAWPSWAASHPEARCPKDLADLNEWMNNKDIRDPWRRDYRWKCSFDGRTTTLVVESAGPDARFGTDDDIGSGL